MRTRLVGPHALTDHEVKILRLLNKGALHRTILVEKLGPRSISGRSSQACALIAGSWCKRLIDNRLVAIECHAGKGFYRAHSITSFGQSWLDTYEFSAKNQHKPEYVEDI